MIDDIDHDFTDDIVCPHCGYEYELSWEISGNEDGASGSDECPECGKSFTWECVVSVKYCTEPAKAKGTL